MYGLLGGTTYEFILVARRIRLQSSRSVHPTSIISFSPALFFAQLHLLKCKKYAILGSSDVL